ncbi:MAG: 30S ribosomal protein S1 [Nitrospirae bacterium GWC2_57_13]|nr:MAG: 30S ribosomal protein S1 [Nitrospirae bacterium GWC2_57_13]OGW43535.1 MAG: 30S ribosomal protein S1 [Nitrospirae bacterium GWD2_57_8]
MEMNDQAANDVAGDDIPQEENFAEMFEQSFKKQERLKPGQMVEAAIVSISADWVFLDLGGKGEGYLDRKELLDADGVMTKKMGDRVKAYFLSAKEEGMRFTTKVAAGSAANAQLEDAWQNGVSVDGMVVKEMKGGFEVRLGGSVRAFCPFSQTGLRRDEPKDGFLGKAMPFRIIEYVEGGRNIVLSRRAIIDEEQEKAKREMRGTLKEGMRVKGRITSIQNFGAFIDIGGLEGLIPASEVSWQRGEKVGNFLRVGQEVEVNVKSLDWERNRIAFSLKDTLPDPWNELADTFSTGSFHSGTVARLAAFGAFVTLAPGVDGLLHISKLGGGKRISHPREVVNEGQKVEVKVESLDRENRKLSLSLAEVSRAEEEAATELKNFQQTSEAEPQAMGSLGDMLKKKMDEKGN